MIYHDPTDGTNIDLYPGEQVLSGDKALEFVRHRHDDRGLKYFSSDFDRNKRQQIVVMKTLEKLKTMTGFVHFLGILDIAGNDIKTDLSENQIEGIIRDFIDVDPKHVVSISNMGSYWDTRLDMVIIPKKVLNRERTALQNAMDIEKDKQSLNNSPEGGQIQAYNP
jgi:polyisoprenyl-teichoic acid--peptidoglycan teichoic acid transferase